VLDLRSANLEGTPQLKWLRLLGASDRPWPELELGLAIEKEGEGEQEEDQAMEETSRLKRTVGQTRISHVLVP
jgi:hypothetical protein